MKQIFKGILQKINSLDIFLPLRLIALMTFSLYAIDLMYSRLQDNIILNFVFEAQEILCDYYLIVFAFIALYGILSLKKFYYRLVLERAFTVLFYYISIISGRLILNLAESYIQNSSIDTLQLATIPVCVFIIYMLFFYISDNEASIPDQISDPSEDTPYLTSEKLYMQPIDAICAEILGYIKLFYIDRKASHHLSLALVSNWGTGKSTAINNLRDRLSESTGSDSAVPVLVEISPSDKFENMMTKFSQNMNDIFSKNKLGPDNVLKNYSESILYMLGNNSTNNFQSLFSSNIEKSYVQNKNKLQQKINLLLEKTDKNYVLIIIDDLDRICYDKESVKKVFTFINEITKLERCISLYSFVPNDPIISQYSFLDKYISKMFYYDNYSLAKDKDFLKWIFDAYMEIGNEIQHLALTKIVEKYVEYSKGLISYVNNAGSCEWDDLICSKEDFDMLISQNRDAVAHTLTNPRSIKKLAAEFNVFIKSNIPDVLKGINAEGKLAEFSEDMFVVVTLCFSFKESVQIIHTEYSLLKEYGLLTVRQKLLYLLINKRIPKERLNIIKSYIK